MPGIHAGGAHEDAPAVGLSLQSVGSATAEQARAGAFRRASEAGDGLRRIEPGASFGGEQSKIPVGAQLAPLLALRGDVHAMIEHASEEVLLFAEAVEMLRLPRGL